jgi:hypothetical protein
MIGQKSVANGVTSELGQLGGTGLSIAHHNLPPALCGNFL